MRKIAFIVGIIGLAFLIALLLNEPKRISSLDGLIVGSFVRIEGIIDEERNFGSGKLMFIGEIPIFCECSMNYSGLNVDITGIIEKFPDDLRLRAFKIEILD